MGSSAASERAMFESKLLESLQQIHAALLGAPDTTLPLQLLDDFFRCIKVLDCDRILKLVQEHPKLLLEVGPQGRTALHAAVIANSGDLVETLLDMAFTDRGLDPQLVDAKDKQTELKAFEITAIVGNKRIGKIVSVAARRNLNVRLRAIDPRGDRNSVEREDYGLGSSSFRGASMPEALSRSGSSDSPEILPDNLSEFGFLRPILPRGPSSDSSVSIEEADLQQIRGLLEPLLSDHPSDLGTSWKQIIMHDGRGKPLDNEFALHSPELAWHFVGLRALTMRALVRRIYDTLGSCNLLTRVLALRDGLGRTLLHVVVDEGYEACLEWSIRELNSRCPDYVATYLNAKDFAGRTPLHWAAAQGKIGMVILLVKDSRTELNASFDMNEVRSLDMADVPSLHMDDVDMGRWALEMGGGVGGFRIQSMTALHLAVLHNHHEVVEVLLNARVPDCRRASVNADIWRKVTIVRYSHDNLYLWKWTPFQIAALKGHVPTLQILLQDDRVYDSGFIKNAQDYKPRYDSWGVQNSVPALNLAAASGNPLAVKALLASGKIDVFATDIDDNTALHYAAIAGDIDDLDDVRDYVTVQHYCNRPPRKKKNFGGIIGCIELLLQSGLDMEKSNRRGEAPELGSSTPENVHRWWYEKIASEKQEAKRNLTKATNAISVTAALVATASFIGPLQPPLGLSSDANWLIGYSRVDHIAVDVFLICDSLSFYLAIASIMLAMIPSLSIPQDGLVLEVHIAERIVQAAVVLLFASITFVICAFSAASIVIVPGNYRAFTVVTTSLGAVLCLVVLLLFFLRLLRLIKPRNRVVSRLYKAIFKRLGWRGPDTPHTRLSWRGPPTMHRQGSAVQDHYLGDRPLSPTIKNGGEFLDYAGVSPEGNSD